MAVCVTTYTYDAANRLLTSSSPQHLISYGWDARGNLIGDGTFAYAYNAAGRMVRAQSITATIVYTYTADGLRVGQAVDGVETTFAWDWAAPVPEVLLAGSTRYLVGHETSGWWNGNRWAYILPDALGSVRQVADGAGAVVNTREWTPYGEEVGGARPGPGYTGEWQDADVGLVYLRALIELRLVAFAAERLGAAMGGPQRFREEMGMIFVVAKTASACGRGCTMGGRIELLDRGRPPEEGTSLGDLIINGWVNFDAWTIVHELGHLWDGRYGGRLSRGLERFTGGRTNLWEGYGLLYSGKCDPPNFRLPGCNRAGYFYGGIPPKGSDINFNREEDFAESVTAYVFPEEAQRQVERWHGTPYERLLWYPDYRATVRWQYMNLLQKLTAEDAESAEIFFKILLCVLCGKMTFLQWTQYINGLIEGTIAIP